MKKEKTDARPREAGDVKISQPAVEPWKPTYRWFVIAASSILIFLVIFFFAANTLLKPYMRVRPLEVTPWLAKGDDAKKVKEAQAPVFAENKNIQ
ncbi:MAG: hypothetical protein FWC57_04390 [Endomicrobia bacterium]|nr:hypothetical protein [Endomicrobiia bacterium]